MGLPINQIVSGDVRKVLANKRLEQRTLDF